MNRISFRSVRILSVLSFAILMSAAAFGQPASASEKLTKNEINSLIATAKTSTQHQRIAQYFEAQSQDYLAQSKEHEEMIAAYKANSSLSTDKNQASTIGHCEYFAKTTREMSVKSHELALLHEQMARESIAK